MKKLIVFSGLDGAGKSTQIALLKEHLDKLGIKNIMVWSRGGYTSGMQLLKDMMRKSGTKIITTPGRSMERERKFKNPIIRKTWIILAIIDLFFLYVIKFRLKAQLGYTIIADRYIDDTAIDFAQNFPEETVSKWVIWKLIAYLCPEPEKHFIALIPVEESLIRSVLKNEPFPDSETVLRFRKSEYIKLINTRKNIVELNGLLPIKDINYHILKELKLENI